MSKLVNEDLGEFLDEARHLRNPFRKKGKPGTFKPSKEWKEKFPEEPKSRYKDHREAAGIPDLDNMEEWEKDNMFPGRKRGVNENYSSTLVKTTEDLKRVLGGVPEMPLMVIVDNKTKFYLDAGEEQGYFVIREQEEAFEGFQGDGDERDGMSGFRGDFKGDTPADQGMRAARKDNYSDPENMLEKAFKGLGITIDDDGIIHPTNKLAKILCNMAVKDGKFEKVADDAYVAI